MVILPADNNMEASSTEKNTIASGNDTENGESIPKDILVISQEVRIVQALACNDVNRRNRQMRKLRKWLQLRSRSSFVFTEDDFMRIWKGLYYNFWLSDKPLVQEELAEQMGRLLECFDGNVELSVNFFGAFMRTMCQQWFGIDQWRIDKFLLLVRRMLRYMFRVLHAASYTEESLQLFNKHMQETILMEEIEAKGLVMHYLDIFCEELAKVSLGKINSKQVGMFVRPFILFIATQRDFQMVIHCRTRILYHLLYQSALGREYSDKYQAWKEMGFPTASINDLERDETSSGTEEEPVEVEVNKHQLDPRAGNVDVFMPELPLDAKYIVEELELFMYKRETTTKCRKMLKTLLNVFKTYQNGKFPLGVKTMPRADLKSEKPLFADKIAQLDNLENEVFEAGRMLKQLNKRKRRKLLKSLDLDNADEGNFDEIIKKAIPKNDLKERRKRAQKAMMSGWIEEAIEDVAQQPKKKKQKLEATEKINKEKVPENIKKLPQKQTTQKNTKETLTFSEKEKKKSNSNASVVSTSGEKNTENVIKIAQEVARDLKMSATKENNKLSEWDEPLAEGEIEYLVPSRKIQLKRANSDLVLNPLAKKQTIADSHGIPAAKNKDKKSGTQSGIYSTPTAAPTTNKTLMNVKRVKIALKHNKAQNPSEYIRQVKSSPNVPHDPEKKPGKGLLKPNSMPSPINPFYKKKIGLRLLNDTI